MIYNALRGSRGTLCICVSDRAGRELGGSGGGGGGAEDRGGWVWEGTRPLSLQPTLLVSRVCVCTYCTCMITIFCDQILLYQGIHDEG